MLPPGNIIWQLIPLIVKHPLHQNKAECSSHKQGMWAYTVGRQGRCASLKVPALIAYIFAAATYIININNKIDSMRH